MSLRLRMTSTNQTTHVPNLLARLINLIKAEPVFTHSHMNSKTRIAAAFLAIVAIAFSIYHLNTPTSSTTELAGSREKQERQSLDSPSTDQATASAPSSQPQAASKESQKQATESKREAVLKLAASGLPAEKFKAYQIAAACAASREKFVANTGDTPGGQIELNSNPASAKEKELCGDLSPAEISQRLQWLDSAAAAGVRGAAQAFALAGPEGQGAPTVPNPEWDARVARYLEAGAREGDVYSLIAMSDRHEMGSSAERDYALALAYYELAMESAHSAEGRNLPREDQVVRRLKSKLSNEQQESIPSLKARIVRKETQ